MLVKCKACIDKKIERSTAYKVVIKGKNEYYCSEKEYKQKLKQTADRENTINIINEIFGHEITHSALNKELKEISEIHSFEKIYSYIHDNKQMLERSLSKDFNSEYGKIRYLSTIIKNNIVDYVIDDEPYITENEYEVLDIKYKPKKKRRAMCDIEKELLEDG